MIAARFRSLRRDERGIAMALTMTVLFICLILGIPALSLTLGSLDRGNRDRRETRALEAADAGADIARWRMNKIVAPGQSSTLGPSTGSAVAKFGCLSINAAGQRVLSMRSTAGWCDPTPWESLDDLADVKQETSYQVSTGLNLVAADPTSLIERRVVATGRVGTVQRRVIMTLRVDPNLSTLALFRTYRYAECSGTQTGSAPDSGCPL